MSTFVGGIVEKINKPANIQLKFTGNWFVDAGILGFINLMEEVYGETWKDSDDFFLNVLFNKMSTLSRNQVNKLFTYAFWYKIIKDTALKWIRKGNFKKKVVKNLIQKDAEVLTKSIENDILKKISDWNYEKSSFIISAKRFQPLYGIPI